MSGQKRNILIVDDDKDLSQITRALLVKEGYEVTCVYNGESAYEALGKSLFHLILLDINLPNELGFDFCKEIRKNSEIPIIFISARTSENDKVVGLDIGGDDYLEKPYSLKELASRVNSLIRRTYGTRDNEGVIKIGDLAIYKGLRVVKKGGNSISLSLKEFDLLLYLAKEKNRAVTKERILSEVWGAFSEVEVSTVSVHIRWLREKLEDNPAKPKYIKTVWGVGYLLSDGELG